MAKSSSEIFENSRFFGSITSSVPFKSLLTKSKQKPSLNRRSKFRSNSENISPMDLNIRDPPLSASVSFPKKSPSKVKINPRKEELTVSTLEQKAPKAFDPSVKVAVRIMPAVGDAMLRKVSDSLYVDERKFTFDAVFESNATQEDIYQSVGAPLVKDALCGYNASIIAYGQTGSGKTYTMWGPQSAMVDDPSVSGLQGVAPRIFQDLFSKIQKEQGNVDGKQINYQCRCSFLEVYDNKIGDLLDPTQRDLEIKDDVKNGFYVENLTEEYVSCYEDITQILIKGLSNRKIGATKINSKSSRSHIMFTCIIESWCKDSSSKCFGSSKTSRICLVDLAGFERNVAENAGRQHVKEGKYIKKSMSQLGRLVNIVAGRLPDKLDEAPYRSSRLTHLLKESFGGNAKLSIICTIRPDHKSSSESIRTLRFGLRARLMKNEPIVNEITEDDVDDLSDQIRQLKEELMRAKSSSSESFESNSGYFSGGNARQSLNLLRQSLNRSLILPCIENDPEENLCINEEDVKELKLHIDKLRSSENGESVLYSAEGCETEFTCEHYLSCSEESEDEEINSSENQTEVECLNSSELVEDDSITKDYAAIDLPPLMNNLSISSSHQLLQDPVLSESPKIRNSQQKSLIFTSKHLEDVGQNLDVMRKSQQGDNVGSSLRSSRIFAGPTESLAASLHRGLQIIDSHQRNCAPARSSVSFSFEHLANVSAAQASPEKHPTDESSGTFVCIKCQGESEGNGTRDSVKTCLVRVDESASSTGLAACFSKDMEKELTDKDLSAICKDQAAQIELLHKKLEQCKCTSDQSVISIFSSSTNFTDLKNHLQPISEEEADKFEHGNPANKLLTWNSEENEEPELIKEKCEIKEVQENYSLGTKQSFTSEEREALLSEIEVLKNKLQLYTDSPTRRSSDILRSSLLSKSYHLRKSSAFVNSGEELEKERQRWMEMESDWISLTDELRIEIESNRQRAEEAEMELMSEKKCMEELDDALKRSVINHARMIEHYADLQEKYNDVAEKHRAVMEGIEEVKKAATKAGGKGRHGVRFAKALSAELSALRVERERERELLRKENRSLKIQLKDTAEAVHAAGELLVRLREAEAAASEAEEKNLTMEEENEKLRKQMEKVKRKHKMEMITMKQYLAESRLPEAALRGPIYRQDSDEVAPTPCYDTMAGDDDQAWRAEFGPIYQQPF
ncbi:kinesin-like protein KIN-12F [Salvia splendens]|uniref:kinesin-like protein KIN-12F n=1 Tax=Salvia splendens TaxID=180675 RepID=UPI00110043B4|nr:kinesin-like protein KIN-12F [Salvia splendens]